MEELLDDLARLEVALQAAARAGAEVAAHGTPDLRGDASGGPRRVVGRHQDRLDRPTVAVEADQQFYGPVSRLRAPDDARPPERDLGVDACAKGFTEVQRREVELPGAEVEVAQEALRVRGLESPRREPARKGFVIVIRQRWHS